MHIRRRHRPDTLPPSTAVPAADPNFERLALDYCGVRLALEAVRRENVELSTKLHQACELGVRALQDGARADLEAERLAALLVDDAAERITGDQ